MWSRYSPSETLNKKISIAPTKTLYYFDGPQIFSAKFGFVDAIFAKIEDDDTYLFLVTTTNDEVINLVETCKLSVRGAFNQSFFWIVETDFNLGVIKYWSTRREEIDQSLLPEPGVSLKVGSPRVPDTIEQAKAFFSVAFRGRTIAHGKMPFSALKGLVDKSYDLARRALIPPELSGIRSGSFDLLVEPTIGSLIISIEKPLIKLSRINRRLGDDLSEDEVDALVANQRGQFFDAFSEIVANPSSQSKEADQARDLVVKFKEIIPDEDADFATIEFSANIGDSVETIFIDTETGMKIREFIERNDLERTSRAGIIIEINAQASTFLLKARYERIITCVIPDDIFRRSNLRIGLHAEVNGSLLRRPRRDKMYATTVKISDSK